MTVHLNPMHARIGNSGNGFFPSLTHGGSLGVIAYPATLATAPDLPKTVLLHFDCNTWREYLTPDEARDLAAALVEMAAKAEATE